MKDYEYPITYNTYQSYLLAKKGYPFKVIAEIRGVSEGTVVNHLIPYIYFGFFSSISDLVSDEIYERVSNYLKQHPYCEQLKLIFEALNGEVSYNDINMCYYYWHNKKRGTRGDDIARARIRDAKSVKKLYSDVRIINEKLKELKYSHGCFLGYIDIPTWP